MFANYIAETPCHAMIAYFRSRKRQRFLLDRLTRIPGVTSIKSSFALKQVRYKTALPLSHMLTLGPG